MILKINSEGPGDFWVTQAQLNIKAWLFVMAVSAVSQI